MTLFSQPPPHNADMEASILAGCMLFADVRDDVLDSLSEHDFYRIEHQRVYQAICKLAAKGTVDMLSVADQLKADGSKDPAGLVSKITDTPVPVDHLQTCDTIRRYAHLRHIIDICTSTLRAAYSGNTAEYDLVAAMFQSQALSVGDGLKASWVEKEALTLESLTRYEDLRDGAKSPAIRTGYRDLDRVTGGGFRGGKLIIVAARPAVGKTALMCNLVANMCNTGACVAVFTLEMSRQDIDDRWIAAGAKVNVIKLTTEPGPDFDEWERINAAADRQMQWRLFVDDTPATSTELVRRIKRVRKQGAEIVFIDQLSAIAGNRNKDTWERNTEHVEALKFLKKEINIPIVLLAQLNRDLEKRSDKRPQLSDLKNTGQLEEDADIVILGYRPFIYSGDESVKHLAEWNVAKNRQGPTFNIRMHWRGECQLFNDIDYHERDGP
jgi:replicative DNA helicase